MARYSFSVYGTSGLKYGQLENNRAYYNASLRAKSLNYRTVYLYWTSVISDPDIEISPGVPALPTHWKLMRNYSGSSDSPYDGIIVDSGLISEYRTTAIDAQLTPNTQVTYSLWIFDGIAWRNCGDATTVVVEESLTPTLVKLEKWLPAAWLNEQYDSIGEPDTSDLNDVLSAYAFAYDKLRTEGKILETSQNYKYMPIQLLKNKIEERGFSYEPVLGDTYHRGLYRVGELVNGTKGTTQAIESYVTALTHWIPEVHVGQNLLLDYNDSSFEESKGRWSTSVGTVEHIHFSASLATVGVTVTAPTPTVYNPNPYFGPRSVAFGWTHGHNTSPVLTLPAATDSKILYGIPVEPATRYRFSGYFRVKDASKTGSAKVKISWYDSTGTLISTTLDGTAVTLTASWQQVFSKSDSGTNGQLAPDNAAYASLTITFTNTSNQAEYIFDMFQFTVANGTTTFEDARKVLVYVRGEKTNLLRNPSFETNGNYWSAHNGALSSSSTPAYAKVNGTKSGKFIAASPENENAGIASEWMPVLPGQTYTFSAYISSPLTKPLIARIEFSSLQSEEEQTEILNDEDGYYYPPTEYYVDNSATLSSTATRISVTAVAPTYAKDAGLPSAKVSLFIDAAASGDTFYVDSAMLERGDFATTYFDGDGANLPADPINNEVILSTECFWENDATSSGKSYRWNNYNAKIVRLAETLPLVLPHACSWEIRSGIPTEDYPELSPSLLKAPSFEMNTDGWITNSSTLVRSVYRGSIFDEYTTHGVAFGKITSTASSAFGIESEKAIIDYLAGYYSSIAIKPENEDAYGVYTLTMRFYDSGDVLLLTKTDTMRIQRSDRWAYMATYATKAEVYGASKASVKIECTPDSLGAGRVFYLDRVVFRQ